MRKKLIKVLKEFSAVVQNMRLPSFGALLVGNNML